MENKERIYADDFELWALECVRIVDKESGCEVPFRLNAPQRRVLAVMEKMRREGRPVRIIMLKARQWGGSTLIQIYMAWMQLVVHTGWNSLTCAHVKDAASGIRAMYSRLLRCYPEKMKGDSPKLWTLSPYEKSASTLYVAARDCQVAIATSMAPNSVRGSNFAMAHLSEVAFWGDGDREVAQEIVRTVSGTVLRCPGSVIVMESTANGKENYFYDEWQRAVRGESDKEAIFVPWHEIELYRRALSPQETGRLAGALDDYERRLLAEGVSLEAVAWYHDKRREYQSHEAMMAEFPSTPDEAFSSARSPVFEPDTVPQAQEWSMAPALAVLVPGHGLRPYALTLCAMQGEKVMVRDVPLTAATPGSILSEVQKAVTPAQIPVVVLECAGSNPAHAPWCARTLADRGVALLYDEDEHPWHSPDAYTLSEWTDTLAELLRAGELCDATPHREQYLHFTLSDPGRTPQVLARLGAAALCRRVNPAADFHSLL